MPFRPTQPSRRLALITPIMLGLVLSACNMSLPSRDDDRYRMSPIVHLALDESQEGDPLCNLVDALLPAEWTVTATGARARLGAVSSVAELPLNTVFGSRGLLYQQQLTCQAKGPSRKDMAELSTDLLDDLQSELTHRLTTDGFTTMRPRFVHDAYSHALGYERQSGIEGQIQMGVDRRFPQGGVPAEPAFLILVAIHEATSDYAGWRADPSTATPRVVPTRTAVPVP